MKLLRENLPASLEPQAEALARCLRAFGAACPVRAVYLFGSHARGEADAQSDVDLCLVVEGASDQMATAALLRRAIREVRPKPPLTLIPISPERLAEKRAAHDPFFATVLTQGVLLAS
jgi:predicted nucleotidyltransferase